VSVYRRGLYSFIWRQGCGRPQKHIKKILSHVFYVPILNIINAWGQGKETHKFVMKRIYLFLIQALMALSLVFTVSCNKDDNSGGRS